MNQLTIVESTIGGMLIGFSAAANMYLYGRVTGISGIVGNLIRPSPSVFAHASEKTWRAVFVVGLILASALSAVSDPDSFPSPLKLSSITYTFAGLAVGFGTRIGNGCTSGHGISGLARFSPRSLVAVCTFMAVGILTATLTSLTKQSEEPWRLATVSWPPNWMFAVLGGLGIVLLVVTSTALAKRSLDADSPHTQYALAAVHLAIGMTFGLGLVVSGMLDQKKVIGFLDVSGSRFGGWDPSLAFVMGGGLVVNTVAHYLARNNKEMRPYLRPEADFYFRPTSGAAPPANWKDPKLVIGSAFFGLGWGMAGICPGPALGGLVHPFTSPALGPVFALWAVAFAAGVWAADAAIAAAKGTPFLVEMPPPSSVKRISPAMTSSLELGSSSQGTPREAESGAQSSGGSAA
mmetsp:Transcript_1877/g.3971  ORF Transcript_1877/g.3971 Transcript_1877/m.3971 type:complete len:406 (-) Transcript_1877:107-1324(-)